MSRTTPASSGAQRLEGRELGVEQRRRHEVVGPRRHPPGEQARGCRAGARRPSRAPARAGPRGRRPQRGARDHDALGRRGEHLADAGEPGQRSSSVSGDAGRHLRHVGRRVQVVRVDEPDPEALREHRRHRRLAAAGHPHDHDPGWLAAAVLTWGTSCPRVWKGWSGSATAPGRPVEGRRSGRMATPHRARGRAANGCGQLPRGPRRRAAGRRRRGGKAWQPFVTAGCRGPPLGLIQARPAPPPMPPPSTKEPP